MERGQSGATLRHLQAVICLGAAGDLSDGALLERFRAGPPDVAETAFAALVDRHGPMVLRVCRATLRDAHDAEDAFQATFLVLARKAGSVRKSESAASWLHGVARRVSSSARSAAARRKIHERRAAGQSATWAEDDAPDDLAGPVHEAIGRLSDGQCEAVVLCDLEGLTEGQAARRLDIPIGTVRSRLARGRRRLRDRLARLGIADPAAMSSTMLAIPDKAAFLNSTARAASIAVSGPISAGGISAGAVDLARRTLGMMLLDKLKGIALAVAAAMATGLVAGGAGLFDPNPVAAPLAEADVMPSALGPDRVNPSGMPSGSATDDEDEPSLDEDLTERPRPWETVVRTKVYGDQMIGFGSGAVISSTPEESIILTCAHTYKIEGARAQPRPSAFPRKIQVDLFDGILHGPRRNQVHFTESFEARVIDLDFASDLALIRIHPGRQLLAARVVPPDWQPRAKMEMMTVGCSEGNDATAWSTTIVDPQSTLKVNGGRYDAIECVHAPKQGRTGG